MANLFFIAPPPLSLPNLRRIIMLQLIKALRLIEANHVGNYSVLVNNAARFVSHKSGWDMARSTAFVKTQLNACKALKPI
jgi:hypothetical protein